jgi:glycosyltransferase involved in cell wall biosynthesis
MPDPIVPSADRLRVLMVHNAYQQRGGEDVVVEAEAGMLRDRGVEVRVLARHNDEVAAIGRLRLAAGTVWSARTGRDFRQAVAGWTPDIVHVHNTFPLISPAIYWAAGSRRLPIVQTLHNFRLLCPQAMLLRDGRVCEDCVGRAPWPAVRHRCYRNSAAQSAVIATMLHLHRSLGTWRDRVTRYIALTAFSRDKLIEGGLPAERISVKPNFVDLPPPESGPRGGFLYVGRLAAEKGVRTLAQALQRAGAGWSVTVAGTGPEAAALQAAPGVRMLGNLAPAAVYDEMRRADALVLPSIWYEGFPRALVEAYACGLPVIASRLGALATLVRDGIDGLLFEPGDADGLAQRLRWANDHPEALQALGLAARRRYEAEWTANANWQQLRAIYRLAIGDAAAEAGPGHGARVPASLD